MRARARGEWVRTLAVAGEGGTTKPGSFTFGLSNAKAEAEANNTKQHNTTQKKVGYTRSLDSFLL